MMRKTPMPRPFSGWFARVRSPRRLPARLSAVAAAWLAGLCVAQAAPERVVTLGGSVTEIVYGLGQGARLVGDDQSSLYPPEARRLPSVGYYRAVPVEGVLSLAGSGAGFGAGRSAGRAQAPGRGRRARGDGARPAFGRFARRASVAEALDARPAGERMIEDLGRELARAEALPGRPARAMLLINRGGARARRERPAAAVGRGGGRAGARRADRDEHVGRGQRRAGRAPGLPGLASTEAAAKRRVVVMDDLLLLGLGPRLPQALTQLKQEVANVMAR